MNNTLSKQLDAKIGKTSVFINCIIIIISLFVLSGWLTGNRLLTSWSSEYISMAPITALLFFLCASLLIGISLRPQWKIFRLLTILTLLATIGSATFVLYCNGITKDAIESSTASHLFSHLAAIAGKMSPLTAIGFICAGSWLIVSLFHGQKKNFDVLSDIFSLGIFTLGLISSIGYLYGMPLLYSGSYVPIALPSSLLFILLGTSFVIQNSSHSPFFQLFFSKSIHSRLFRVFLPAILLLMTVTEWLFTLSTKYFKFENFNPVITNFIMNFIFLLIITLIIMFISRWIGKDLESAQSALRISEDRYAMTFQAVNAGIWDWNVPTGNAFFNEHYYFLLGYMNKEFPSTYNFWKTLVHPEDIDRVEKELNQSIKNGTGFEIELRMKTKNGEWKWVATRGNEVEKDLNGNVLRMVGTLSDISKRKAIETALLESEKKYRILADNSKDVFFTLDMNLCYTYVSPSVMELRGFTPQELIGKSVIEELSASSQAIVRQLLLNILDTPNMDIDISRLMELEICRKDGTKIWIEARLSFIKSENNVPIGIMGATRDIEDRKLAEEAAAAEHERLAVTLRSIGDGVITTDTQENIVIMNKVAEELTGWLQAEVIGKPVSDIFNIVSEKTREQHESLIKKVIASGTSIESVSQSILISRNGKEKLIADNCAPIKDSKGETIGAVMVFRDMTEKQKMTDNMQRAQKLESVGVLAAGIAHDFNNLLSIIYGYLQIATMETKDPEVTENLNLAVKTMKRAKDLTTQLLTFSKGGAPVKKTVLIPPFIQETVKFALSGSNCAAEFNIEDKLWTSDFDENQIGQVINNLVINALHAMPLGGTLSILANNITLKDGDHLNLFPGDYVRISFKDTGIGMSKEILDRIFDPFFTTKQKGSGLGLTSSYSIMKKHDGFLDAQSEPGKGSQFFVWLPASKKTPSKIEKHQSISIKGEGRIIIMDDEEDLRMLLGKLLRSFGFTPVYAKEGKNVLALLSDPEIDKNPLVAILLDLTIPGGMGGKETVQEIRKFNQNLPVFVYSGYSEDPVMANPQSFGFTDSISKPFTPEELIVMLSRNLKNNPN